MKTKIIKRRRLNGQIRNKSEAEKVKELSEKLERILKVTDSVTWVYHVKTDRFSENSLCMDLLGYDEEEVNFNKNFIFQVVHPEDAHLLKSKMVSCILKETEGYNVEWRAYHKDKGYIWLHCIGKPSQWDKDDNILEIMGLTRVIHDRKILEIENINEKEKTEYLMNYDSLTGLYSPKYIASLLEQYNEDPSIKQVFGIYLNIDHFRHINELYTNEIGDKYLIKMAQVLLNFRISNSIVARISGDEFFVVGYGDYNENEIAKILEEEIEKINSQYIYCATSKMNVSVTSGYAIYPIDTEDCTKLLNFAEDAMVDAKKNNKRRTINRFDKKIYDRNQYKKEIVKEVEKADIEKEFEMYFQPIIHIQKPDLYIFETLMRWNHPIRGLLKPDDFLEIIQETGQILKISRVMFIKILQQINEWRKITDKKIVISFNLCPVSLNTKDFGKNVMDMLNKYGIDSSQVYFEITENMAISNNKVMTENLKIFRDNHIKIALDDFGMHYSTLSLLDKMEYDALKIDIYFVRNIHKPIPKSVVKMIKEITDINQKECIVEGIETEEQYYKMKELGFEIMQGYYFDKPMKAQCITELLSKNESSDNVI